MLVYTLIIPDLLLVRIRLALKGKASIAIFLVD